MGLKFRMVPHLVETTSDDVELLGGYDSKTRVWATLLNLFRRLDRALVQHRSDSSVFGTRATLINAIDPQYGLIAPIILDAKARHVSAVYASLPKALAAGATSRDLQLVIRMLTRFESAYLKEAQDRAEARRVT